MDSQTVFTRQQSACILNYEVYTRREVIAIFELRSVHTSDRICGFAFESGEKRHGCVWVFAVLFTFPVLLYVLNMCSAWYYRRKWLEGHTSSAPQITI